MYNLHKFIFNRIIREISDEIKPDLRWQLLAVQALHEISEMYVTNLFNDSNLVAIHAGRVTVDRKDLQLVRRLRGETT